MLLDAVVLSIAVEYCLILLRIVRCCPMLVSAVRFGQRCSVLFSGVKYCLVLLREVQCGSVLIGAVQCYLVV